MSLGEGGKQEVIDELSQYKMVIVSGPQRSGTTITAKMLSEDLGYEFINEFDGRFRNNFDNLNRLADHEQRFVVQAPVMCNVVQKLNKPGMAVVMMIRDRAEIIRSQDRINWTKHHEPTELAAYKKTWGVADGRICDVKYDIWEQQKPQMQVPYYEMQYESAYMKDHRLYREPKQRKNFGPKQTA